MLPNITSLRFFLALFVLIFHLAEFSKKNQLPFYDELALFHKGTEAVYVFFSLSGFLIIRQLYLEKIETHTISLNKFFRRRMSRIFPLYVVILIFGLLYYNIILPKMGYPFEINYNLAEALVLCFFFMPNVFAVLYDPGAIIGVLWSIGIEEQFYLFIAPSLLLAPRKRILAFLALFTMGYFVLFFTDYFQFLRQFSMLFFYFSAAGLAAILQLKYAAYFKNTNIRNILLLLLIAYFTTTIFQENLSPQLYHLSGLLLFSSTIAFLAARPIFILNNQPLIYLGKISYGIYMYHVIVIQLVAFVVLKIDLASHLTNTVFIITYNSVVILISILASHLSYKYFETYFMKPKKLPK